MKKLIVFLSCFLAQPNAFAGGKEALSTAVQTGGSIAMVSAMSGGAAAASATAAGSVGLAGTHSGICAKGQAGFCVMAGLGLVQAAMQLGTGKSEQGAVKSMVPSAVYPTADLGNGLTGSQLDNQIAFSENALNKATANLKKVAPNIDTAAGTVKTPKGTMSLGGLNSGKAMLDAGLIDPSQVAAIDDALKKSGFNMPAMSAGVGGGGGGGSSAKPTTYSMEAFQMPTMPSDKPNAPVAAGLVKLANGEPIGTASDNIFNMLHNRYQIKVKEKIFVGQEAPSAN